MRRFLVRLSGGREDLLRDLPGDRAKHEGLGTAIVITAGLATVSMWFALFSAVGVNPVVAGGFAVVWGFVILSLDRWLVVSMPSGGRRWRFAVPRIMMAVLLGAVISTPLVLQIFKAEIDAQIVQIQQRRANDFSIEQQRGAVGQDVARRRAAVDGYNQIIASGGDVPADPANDPKIQSLTAEREAHQKEKDKHYAEWQCQLYGGDGCTRKGPGPLADASKRAHDQAAAKVQEAERAIAERRQQLTANDESSRSARVQQARDELPHARTQLTEAVERQTHLQRRFDTENRADNGLLIRLQALNEASGGDATLSAARILLFLLFLLIECLPVAVKLMHRPGRYEELVEVAEAAAFRDARDRMRGGRDPHPHAPGGGTGRGAPTLRGVWAEASAAGDDSGPVAPPEGPSGAPSGVPDPRTVPYSEGGPPPSPPPPYRPGPAGAGPENLSATGTGERPVPDDLALRTMRDTRARPPTFDDGPVRPVGGSPQDRDTDRPDGVVLYTKDDDDF